MHHSYCRKDISSCCKQLRKVKYGLHIVHDVTCRNNNTKKIHFPQNEKKNTPLKQLRYVGPPIYEPPCEKTGLRGFRPGQTQTKLYYHTRKLDAQNFLFRNYRDCTVYVAKTKALISFAVTAKLICGFVFAYA